jgi:hypothetical protein
MNKHHTLVQDLKGLMFMQNRFTVLRFLKYSTLLLMLLLISFSNFACGKKSSKAMNIKTSGNVPDKVVTEEYPDDIKVKQFRNPDSTWGFTVYLNGKIYIHQQAVPGVQPASGFKSEQDAGKVSELIVKKIKNHSTSETVNQKELDSLGVIITNTKTR